MPAHNATAGTCIASLFAVAPLRAPRVHPGMGNSSIGVLVMVMLGVAFAVFLLTPHERISVSSGPPSFWSSQR